MDSTSAAKKISVFLQMIFPSFLYDVLVTLVYRRHNGENVFSVRREHHYQLLIRLGLSHQAVSALYFLIVAVHGVAAVLVYACQSIALYRAAMRAGLATVAGTSARRDERG